MKLIVGLGNPGDEYAKTRHNAGFWVVDEIARSLDGGWKNEKARHALTSKVSFQEQDVLLAKPQMFMNESGQAVAALMSFYKIKPADVLIVQDDMDIETGKFKFHLGGRAAGHHGIESIQELLPGMELNRLRVGIGRPDPPQRDGADWVLSKADQSLIDFARQTVSQAALDWCVKL